METALVDLERGSVVLEQDLPKLVDKFLASLDVRANSRRTYRTGLMDFLSCVTAPVTREKILAYRDRLKERVSATTANSYLVAVRQFFQYLEAEKVYPNVAKGVKGLKRTRGFGSDHLWREQALRLLTRQLYHQISRHR